MVCKVFKKLVNNGFVDNLEKYGLFFYFQYNFRFYWSTADLAYLIELLELIIDLGLVELQHLIYSRLLTESGMLVFFTNLSLMGF